MDDSPKDVPFLSWRAGNTRLFDEGGFFPEGPDAGGDDDESEPEESPAEQFYRAEPPPPRGQTVDGEGSMRYGHPLHPGGRSRGYGAQHSGNFPEVPGQHNRRVQTGHQVGYDSPDAYASRHRQQGPVSTWRTYVGKPQPWWSEQGGGDRGQYGAEAQFRFQGGRGDYWSGQGPEENWDPAVLPACTPSEQFQERDPVARQRAPGPMKPYWKGNPKPLHRRPVAPSSIAERDAKVRQKIEGVVELNSEGWVVANCEGRQRWLADLREGVTRGLDVSIPRFAQQDPADWSYVMESLAAKWEYVGHPHGIARACLEKHAKDCLKNNRYKLHELWKKGGCNPGMPAPSIVDAVHWSKLIRHFQSEQHKKSSEKGSAARGNVKNANLMGRLGNSSIIEELKTRQGRLPSNAEVRAEVKIAHEAKTREKTRQGRSPSKAEARAEANIAHEAKTREGGDSSVHTSGDDSPCVEDLIRSLIAWHVEQFAHINAMFNTLNAALTELVCRASYPELVVDVLREHYTHIRMALADLEKCHATNANATAWQASKQQSTSSMEEVLTQGPSTPDQQTRQGTTEKATVGKAILACLQLHDERIEHIRLSLANLVNCHPTNAIVMQTARARRASKQQSTSSMEEVHTQGPSMLEQQTGQGTTEKESLLRSSEEEETPTPSEQQRSRRTVEDGEREVLTERPMPKLPPQMLGEEDSEGANESEHADMDAMQVEDVFAGDAQGVEIETDVGDGKDQAVVGDSKGQADVGDGKAAAQVATRSKRGPPDRHQQRREAKGKRGD